MSQQTNGIHGTKRKVVYNAETIERKGSKPSRVFTNFHAPIHIHTYLEIRDIL